MKLTTSSVMLLAVVAALSSGGCRHGQTKPQPPAKGDSPRIEHFVAASQSDKFCGWPANNGLWTWDRGKEILVGFSFGNYVEQSGHNIQGKSDRAEGILSRLARSGDGGRTWQMEDPDNYVGDGNEVSPSPGGIVFDDAGFAMRVVGVVYHGAYDSQGHFFISKDRGHNWRGPFRFTGLMEDANLRDMEFTSRTRYLVTGPDSCLVFMSARPKENGGGRDKSFVAETTDGGRTFHFISWIVPRADPYRAAMPAVVKTSGGSIVAALRRRTIGKDVNWVDSYGSADNGRTWTFLSRVGETGDHNGNPPGLVLLNDGRLACAYGDRTRARLFARLSSDGGKTWSNEIIVREDFQPDRFDDKDFGYPQLARNHRGELVAIYYWATKDYPQQQIAATILAPGKVK